MVKVTLSEVKSALNIDFDDQDAFLVSLLKAATARATSVTGTFVTYNEATEEVELYDGMNEEVSAAIIEDVSQMYANRSAVSGSSYAIGAYRRNSRMPML